MDASSVPTPEETQTAPEVVIEHEATPAAPVEAVAEPIAAAESPAEPVVVAPPPVMASEPAPAVELPQPPIVEHSKVEPPKAATPAASPVAKPLAPRASGSARAPVVIPPRVGATARSSKTGERPRITILFRRARAEQARARAEKVWAFSRVNGFKAAGVAVILGLGWVLGANTFDRAADTRGLVASVNQLHGKVAGLEASASKSATARNELATLRKTNAELKANLEASRAASTTAVAQITAKLERLDRDHATRLEKLERKITSPDVTASIPLPPLPPAPSPSAAAAIPKEASVIATATPLPTPKEMSKDVPKESPKDLPKDQPKTADRSHIPPNGWVLREVSDGTALVEGRSGLREIAPGDTLPGAGRVEGIERRGKSWVVVTSNGIIDGMGY